MLAWSREAACMSTLFPRQSMALASRIDCAAVTEAKMVSACFTSLLSTVESSWLPKLSSWLLPLDPAAPDESFGRWASAAPSSMHSASVVDIEPHLISACGAEPRGRRIHVQGGSTL